MGTQKNGSRELIDIAPVDLRRLPRPHKGFDDIGPFLAKFYRQNESALRIEGIDLDGMLDDIGAFQDLAEPEHDIAAELSKVHGTRLVRASRAWLVMLEIYARAVVVGRVNPTVRAGIAEFAAFMKRGKRKAKAAAPAGA